ncbi:hypothetical protein [Flavobacterium psychrotrophum]|uniref:hypothetical protein n=1 Tax=Flavobacterium psychrotrophum TaxID=2294119 RepID=UPI0013C464BB|nr:hypothetical protein [Flavobacterium psychrotrophum]
MIKIANRALAALCLLCSFFLYAQDNKETASKAVAEYFFLDRENIHVQCNKSIYVTNEQIWFKGYVFHRKKNMPFFTTINVFATLTDETGQIYESKLLYANIGSFSGSFKLNSKIKSGRYYLQFYTSWMNNFTEDESAVTEVTIINEKFGPGNALSPADTSTVNIGINPEGGTFLSGVSNNIGITVSNCNKEPMDVSVIDIVDSKGQLIKKVQINKLGYGRFDLFPKAGETYKAILTVEDKKHEQALPQVQNTGLALEINNYTTADKTIITVRTNADGAKNYTDPFTLLIHKDDVNSVYEIDFKGKTEVKFAISKNDLSDGLNTTRLLDKDLNEVAQRLIYKYPTSTEDATFTRNGSNVASQTTDFNTRLTYPNMEVSISVLPENTISIDEANDIYSSLWLLPYIDTVRKANGKYYFTTLSKAKAYELDIYLLNQKSKYTWQNITQNPPKSTNLFDMGLILKGTVPAKLINKYAKVRLYSLAPRIDEVTEMDEKGDFYFNNFIIADSTHINFTLLTKGAQPKELNIKPILQNGNKKFNKTFKPLPRCVIQAETQTEIPAPEFPNFTPNTITLEETVIEKTRLKYEKSFGNSNLNGRKISVQDANLYHTALQYITARGSFKIDTDGSIGGNVHLYSRSGRTSLNGAQQEPIIYIDNIQQLDHNQLNVITMNEVDEIYMNPTAIVPSLRNYSGIIKLYLKHDYSAPRKNGTPDIMVKGGYARIEAFENARYNSTTSKGFENFGVISWEPSLMADENGVFTLKIPTTGQKTVKVLIEGFSADGKLISEIKTLNLQ